MVRAAQAHEVQVYLGSETPVGDTCELCDLRYVFKQVT